MNTITEVTVDYNHVLLSTVVTIKIIVPDEVDFSGRTIFERAYVALKQFALQHLD
jgi:hypothetical protein